MSSPPEVGYKRPPEHGRWKKGQSGNSRRRYPARSVSAVEMIDEEFLRPIDIVENGLTRRVSTLEAIILQLWRKEVSGDRRALTVRLKYQEFARQNTKQRVEITFVDSDYTRALAAGGLTASTADE
jgi:Family of unknown function (DUF5681)